MIDRDVMLSTGEAAHYLGVSKNTVRRWCRSEIMPHRLYPGGILRISAKELKDFIEIHKKSVPNAPNVPHAPSVK